MCAGFRFFVAFSLLAPGWRTQAVEQTIDLKVVYAGDAKSERAAAFGPYSSSISPRLAWSITCRYVVLIPKNLTLSSSTGPACRPATKTDSNAMADVMQIPAAIEQRDPHAREQLLPLACDELRQLAAENPAHEQPRQPL